jgi:hypothetical protein
MRLDDVSTWPLARGKKEYMKYLQGERITTGQAVLANCYSCMCGYTDGKTDCGNKSCPIYPFMPYREGGGQKLRAGRSK